MDDRPPLPHYDPGYCYRVTKWAASICVGWLAIELFILIFVDPGNSSCPGWTIRAGERSEASLWFIASVITGLPTAWIVFIALRWKYFSQRYYDMIARYPEFILFLNADRLYLEVIIGWCLFCALPLLIMTADCTSLLQDLGLRVKF